MSDTDAVHNTAFLLYFRYSNDDMLEWLEIESPADFDPEYFEKKHVKFRDPKKVLKQYERRFGV